jgi:beta-exotoxin I transport system ATP-binding protein
LPNSSSRHATRSEERARQPVDRGRVVSDPSLFTPASPGPSAIHLEQISKKYRSITAVANLTLDVHQGEIFGFLGLNGAGKTTTIRIILDLVRPTSGRALVFGFSCREDSLSARSRIGYLPGELGLYGDMTGAATLDVLARLSDAEVDRARQRELLERMQLSASDLQRKVREYSTGMKRKLGIVQAFQADPPLLILDEPTEGLDPLMQDALYDLLADTRRRGRTVFMSSHVLSEVERVCDRIGLLRRGELVLVSAVADVRSMAARHVRVVFRDNIAAPSADVQAGLPSDCEVIELTPRMWTLRVRGPLGPLLASISQLPVEDIEVREPSLEEVVKAYYTDDSPAS